MTVVPPGKCVRALVGAPYNSTGAEFDICTYFSAKDDVNSVSFRDNATRVDEMELTDGSASISIAEQISTFCTDAQCDNIAFSCDRNSKLTNNDVIIGDNLGNEVLRVSQVSEVNEVSRSDVCRSDESNNEGFHFDVFQSDDKEIELSRSDVCRSDESNNEGFHFDVFQSDDKEIEFSRSDVCRSDDSKTIGFHFDVFQSDDKEIEFSRCDVCRSDGSKTVGFHFDVFQSDDKEVDFFRSDVCRSDDSNNVSFRFDVSRSDDIEIPLLSPNVCRNDHSDSSRLEDVDYSAERDTNDQYLMLAEMIKNSSLILVRTVKLPLAVILEQTNSTFCIVMI